MNDLPTTTAPDSTIAVLREGYRFIPNRMRQLDTHIFATRLLLKPAICVTGTDAAAMFYHPDRFTRVGAMPPTTIRLLQDLGSVQANDAERHHHRKAMFMSLMTPENIDRLLQITGQQWERHLDRWISRDEIVLFDEVDHLLTMAVCEWAGVPVEGAVADRRTEELSLMIEGAGGIGPTTWKALRLRNRTEAWARERIAEVRNGTRHAPEESAVHVFATSRDLDGHLLPLDIAAVELINILRPTVAVGRFITFVAHALEHEPESRRFLTSGRQDEATWFTNEVRRFYPFFPFIGGIVRESFVWQGHRFDEGAWVILDLYGTNHDPDLWDFPQAFQPDRFRNTNITPFNLIPQGAGEDFTHTHRCAGEWITIGLVRQAALFLSTRMRYTVPDQDMSISLRQMPARPQSGMILRDIHPA